VVAKRCAAQIFTSSHWVQGSPLPRASKRDHAIERITR
jgi:hypothetical protein